MSRRTSSCARPGGKSKTTRSGRPGARRVSTGVGSARQNGAGDCPSRPRRMRPKRRPGRPARAAPAGPGSRGPEIGSSSRPAASVAPDDQEQVAVDVAGRDAVADLVCSADVTSARPPARLADTERQARQHGLVAAGEEAVVGQRLRVALEAALAGGDVGHARRSASCGSPGMTARGGRPGCRSHSL